MASKTAQPRSLKGLAPASRKAEGRANTKSHRLSKRRIRKGNPARLYLGSLKGAGRRTQKQALRLAVNFWTGNPQRRPEHFSWHRLTYEHLATLRSWLEHKYAPATANRVLSAVRQVVRHAWRCGFLERDEMERVIDVRSVRGRSLPRGREVPSAEIAAVYEACRRDESPFGARDGAIVALLHAAGLRRAEVGSLDLQDVDLDRGLVEVRSGKGGRGRRTWLGDGLGWVRRWAQVRGDWPGPLIHGLHGSYTRGLSPSAVYDVVKVRSAQAGVECTAHDLRRTFATVLLRATSDLSLVKRLMGHESLDTTTIYDMRGDEEAAIIQRHLAVPRA
jgi:integrase